VYGQASQGGAAYVRIGGLSQIITKYTKIRGALTITSGLLAALPNLNDGSIDYTDLSPTQPVALYKATNVGQTVKCRLRLMANGGGIASSFLTIASVPKTGIKTGADLKGKRLTYDPGTNWAKPIFVAILQANGLTEADATFVPGDTASEFQWVSGGQADAMCQVLGTNTAQLAQTSGLALLAMTPKEQAACLAVTDYSAGIIPKGMFGASVDTPGLTSPLALWFRAGINNITMYTLTQCFWQHIDEYHQLQDKCQGYLPENNLQVFNVPWHPGAIKYYQEQGWWTNDSTTQNMAAIVRERALFGGEVPDLAAYQALGVIK